MFELPFYRMPRARARLIGRVHVRKFIVGVPTCSAASGRGGKEPGEGSEPVLCAFAVIARSLARARERTYRQISLARPGH